MPKSSNRVFTEEQVIEIRNRYAENKTVTLNDIAKEYAVHQFTIYSIVHGLTYAEVGGEIVFNAEHRQGNRRLSQEQVEKLRREIAYGKKPITQLAVEYGITESHLYRIAIGKNWKGAAGPRTRDKRDRNPKRPRSARFTDEQIIEIRTALDNGENPCDIARQHGVSSSAIYKIRDREIYKHVE